MVLLPECACCGSACGYCTTYSDQSPNQPDGFDVLMTVADGGAFSSASGTFSGFASAYAFSWQWSANPLLNNRNTYRALNGFGTDRFAITQNVNTATQRCISIFDVSVGQLVGVRLERRCEPEHLGIDGETVIPATDDTYLVVLLMPTLGEVVTIAAGGTSLTVNSTFTGTPGFFVSGAAVPARVYGNSIIDGASVSFDFTITSIPPHGFSNPLP